MQAGRDIVGSGTRLSGASAGVTDTGQYTFTGNLFVHNSPTDISIASAGRDILYSSFNVAGPGTLELTAGRNIQMEDKVAVNSLGAVAAGDSRPGASIVMQAGMGPNGPDYRRFVEAYLNPANLAQPGESLQGSKVAKTYENELVSWLTECFGFAGDSEQARTYYAALPAEQQRIFARDVYFAELKAAGREYNQDGSVRQGSYVRGRTAIARLFPRDRRGRQPDHLQRRHHDVRRRGRAHQLRWLDPDAHAGWPPDVRHRRRCATVDGWRDHSGRRRYPVVFARQHPAWAEPNHDHLRRLDHGLDQRGRHQRRARFQDYRGVHAAQARL